MITPASKLVIKMAFSGGMSKGKKSAKRQEKGKSGKKVTKKSPVKRGKNKLTFDQGTGFAKSNVESSSSSEDLSKAENVSAIKLSPKKNPRFRENFNEDVSPSEKGSETAISPFIKESTNSHGSNIFEMFVDDSKDKKRKRSLDDMRNGESESCTDSKRLKAISSDTTQQSSDGSVKNSANTLRRSQSDISSSEMTTSESESESKSSYSRVRRRNSGCVDYVKLAGRNRRTSLERRNSNKTIRHDSDKNAANDGQPINSDISDGGSSLNLKVESSDSVGMSGSNLGCSGPNDSCDSIELNAEVKYEVASEYFRSQDGDVICNSEEAVTSPNTSKKKTPRKNTPVKIMKQSPDSSPAKAETRKDLNKSPARINSANISPKKNSSMSSPAKSKLSPVKTKNDTVINSLSKSPKKTPSKSPLKNGSKSPKPIASPRTPGRKRISQGEVGSPGEWSPRKSTDRQGSRQSGDERMEDDEGIAADDSSLDIGKTIKKILLHTPQKKLKV